MQKIQVSETFVLNVLDKGEKIDLLGKTACEGHLSQIYIKPDGSLEDKPTIAVVIEIGTISGPVKIVGQLSYEMLKPVILELQKLEV